MYKSGRLWPMGQLLLLLLNALYTRGKIYENATNVELEVGNVEAGARLCVKPMEEHTRLQLHLVMKPSREGQEVTVGSTLIRKKWLTVGQLHNLTVQYYIANNQGKAIIDPCPPENLLSSLSTTQFPLKPGGKATASSWSSPRDIQNNAAKLLPSHTILEMVKHAASTTPTPHTSPGIDSNTTEEEGIEESESNRSFLMVLGAVGGVPVVVLLAAALLVGVVVGVVSVLLCSRCRRAHISRRRDQSGLRRTPVYADTIRGTLSFLNRNSSPDRMNSSGFNSWSSRANTPLYHSNNNTAERKDNSTNTTEERNYSRTTGTIECKCSSTNSTTERNYCSSNNAAEGSSAHSSIDRGRNSLSVRNQQSSPRGSKRSRPEISFPIIEGNYSVPHITYTDAELIPLKTASSQSIHQQLDQNTQLGTFRYIKH
ncbi:uncharacterized protein [Procambarus clarkii]|uniref:uncharacterized protein isoform X2 n=1 Tax=Procambarus clarkii TaxID=6728 RepID=UPI003743E4C9